MITYDKIIDTVTELTNNDLIYKNGLTLEYTLSETIHKKLEESVFMKSGGTDWNEFEHQEEFELEFGKIIIKFVRNES